MQQAQGSGKNQYSAAQLWHEAYRRKVDLREINLVLEPLTCPGGGRRWEWQETPPHTHTPGVGEELYLHFEK